MTPKGLTDGLNKLKLLFGRRQAEDLHPHQLQVTVGDSGLIYLEALASQVGGNSRARCGALVSNRTREEGKYPHEDNKGVRTEPGRKYLWSMSHMNQ